MRTGRVRAGSPLACAVCATTSKRYVRPAFSPLIEQALFVVTHVPALGIELTWYRTIGAVPCTEGAFQDTVTPFPEGLTCTDIGLPGKR